MAEEEEEEEEQPQLSDRTRRYYISIEDRTPEQWAALADKQRKRLATVKSWREYREDEDKTKLKDLKTYSTPEPSGSAFKFKRYPKAPADRRRVVRNKQQEVRFQKFLRQAKAETLGELRNAAPWKFKKLLGEGNFGRVSLYEYQGAAPRTEKQVVVKEITEKKKEEGRGLEVEASILVELNASQSPHIIKLREQSAPVDLVVERIYLEYCPEGSLAQLLGRRMRR